jgi:hypothetical protein
MKLLQLNEKMDETTRVEMKISRLRSELKEIMKKAGSVFQSGIKPEYKNLVDKKKREIAVATEELEAAKNKPGIEAELHAANKAAAEKAAAITPEDKAKQFSDSVKKGFDDWSDMRTKHGGDAGLNLAIHAAAKKQTDDSKYDLNVEQLAKEFGVPGRSMYKRLETTAMHKTAMMMPKNRK